MSSCTLRIGAFVFGVSLVDGAVGSYRSIEDAKRMKRVCEAERQLGRLKTIVCGPGMQVAREKGRYPEGSDVEKFAEALLGRYIELRYTADADPSFFTQERTDFLDAFASANASFYWSARFHTYEGNALSRTGWLPFCFRANDQEFYNQSVEHFILMIKMKETKAVFKPDPTKWLPALINSERCSHIDEDHAGFWKLARDYMRHREKYDETARLYMDHLIETVRAEILDDSDPLGICEDAPITEAQRRICDFAGVDLPEEIFL